MRRGCKGRGAKGEQQRGGSKGAKGTKRAQGRLKGGLEEAEGEQEGA